MSRLPQKIALLKTRLIHPLPGGEAHAALFPRIVVTPPEIPENARESAVLALLYEKNDALFLLFIKRTEDGKAHSSQISFPGGKMETTDTNLQAAALREAWEEIGISRDEVVLLGALTPLYIPVSNFKVAPFLGFLPALSALEINAAEVAYPLSVPVEHLLDENRRIVTTIVSPVDPENPREVHAYRLEKDEILWGATAMITAEIVMLLRELEID